MITFFFLLIINSLNFSNAYTRFPAGSCAPQNCTVNSPYIFESNNIGNDTFLCLDVKSQYCDRNVYCCNNLYDRVQKIVFKTDDKCFGSVKNIYFNNLKKTGGVYFDKYNGFSELRITNLNMNANTFVNSKICIYLQYPCPTNNDFYDNLIIYSVYDPFTHGCCPVCQVDLDETSNNNLIPNPNPSSSPIMSPIFYPSPSPIMSPIFYPSPSPIMSPIFYPAPSPIMSPVMSPINNPITSPIPPNEIGSDSFRLIIKAPILDDVFISTLSCKTLEDNYGNQCKIVFTSTTGIYYGINIYSDYNEFIKSLTTNIGYFTMLNNILCDSTILVVSKINGINLEKRYKASTESCSYYYNNIFN